MMKFLKSLLLSVTVAALSLGLNISAFSAPLAEAAVSDWQKGASIASRYAEDFGSDGFKESVRNLKATGANYVALIIPWRQGHLYSTDVTPAWHAPSNATLGAAIDYIHSQGMKVMLKPHLDPDTTEWRAGIKPGDRDAWFANYGALLNNLGQLAEEHGAEQMSIGAELIDMATYTSNSDNTQRWVTMINNLRNVYSGKLTYSANWGDGDYATEVPHIGFWGNLDYIGVSAYYPIYGDTNSVDSLAAGWNNWEQRIKSVADQYGKPVLFTEVGYRSTWGANNQPFAHWGNNGYDPQGQANLYDALFTYWNAKPYMAGVMFWDWNSNPAYGGEGNVDYTPQHKPAQQVLARWFSGSGSGTTTPPVTSQPTGTISSSATISGTTLNAPSTVTVNLQTTGSASNVIVDVEVFNPSGTRILQEFWGGETLGAQAKQYAVTFTPQVAGTYTVKAGVFNSNWTTAYHWNDAVTRLAIGQGQTNPPAGTTTPPTSTTTPPTTPPVTGEPTGTLSASATVTSPAVGSPASVAVTLNTTGSASNVITDIEIYNQSGTKVSQEFWGGENLTSSQPRQYTYSFTPQSTGTHTLKVGVFSSDWSKNYFWGDSVLQFTPGSDSTPPTGTTTNPNPSQPTGTITATGSMTGGTKGSPTTVTARLSTTGSAQGVLVDLEVFDPNGNRVQQEFWGNESLSSSAKAYTTIFTPQMTGTYTVKAGVFNSDWTKNYFWTENVFQFTVSASDTPNNNPIPTTPTGDYTTNIWWPTDGATVSGLQPLKAMVEGLDVSQYKMYWQVDGDVLNEMGDSNEDYPHKESLVDFTGWNWKGDGLYNINFVSKNHSGSTISSKSVNIHITN